MSPEAPEPHRETVDPGWVDYNGHMNVAYYVLVFDHATDAMLDRLGLGAAYRARTGRSVFVGEMHVRYLQEVLAGDELCVRTRLLAHDAKRAILFHEMSCPRHPTVVACNEVLCVHVDLEVRRAAPWPADIAARLGAEVAGDAARAAPRGIGRSVRLPAEIGLAHSPHVK